ncbi:hypothetical protein MOUN0_B04720 [Monosporozyma unispora]
MQTDITSYTESLDDVEYSLNPTCEFYMDIAKVCGSSPTFAITLFTFLPLSLYCMANQNTLDNYNSPGFLIDFIIGFITTMATILLLVNFIGFLVGEDPPFYLAETQHEERFHQIEASIKNSVGINYSCCCLSMAGFMVLPYVWTRHTRFPFILDTLVYVALTCISHGILRICLILTPNHRPFYAFMCDDYDFDFELDGYKTFWVSKLFLLSFFLGFIAIFTVTFCYFLELKKVELPFMVTIIYIPLIILGIFYCFGLMNAKPLLFIIFLMWNIFDWIYQGILEETGSYKFWKPILK